MITLSLALSLFALAGAAPQAGAAGDAPRSAGAPVVVELFTSQGCPKCPDANRFLAELAGDGSDVLALAYGVDYWNLFGWEDRFAQPAFVERQRAYVEAHDLMRVFTPHFVVNGAPERQRYAPDQIRAAVADAPAFPASAALEIAADEAVIRLDGPGRAAPAPVWLVAYDPGAAVKRIDGGANAGVDMVHFNMVRALIPAGEWAGGAQALSAPLPAAGEAYAVLVQDGRGGAIIAAARAD